MRSTRDYFEWLCDYISVPGVKTDEYTTALKFLFSVPFVEKNSMDINRIKDALNLRNEYFREIGIRNEVDEDTSDVSVFEVLAALSIRCERDIIGEPGNELWGRLFWEMLHNVKVDMNNATFDEPTANRYIQIWLDRKYKSNGVGGVFPLRKTYLEDQTQRELWYQMQSYISENY